MTETEKTQINNTIAAETARLKLNIENLRETR
jgi:hypothetical protein